MLWAGHLPQMGIPQYMSSLRSDNTWVSMRSEWGSFREYSCINFYSQCSLTTLTTVPRFVLRMKALFLNIPCIYLQEDLPQKAFLERDPSIAKPLAQFSKFTGIHALAAHIDPFVRLLIGLSSSFPTFLLFPSSSLGIHLFCQPTDNRKTLLLSAPRYCHCSHRTTRYR